MPKWKRLLITQKMWHMICFVTSLHICQIISVTLGVNGVDGTTDKTIFYKFVDNITEGTGIGNIKRDAKLNHNFTRDQLEHTVFSFLQNHQAGHQRYFKLRENVGLLKTVDNVDRDELCPGLKSCVIKLDVAFRVLNKFFGTIRVIINLEDYNDNAPKFDQRSMEYHIPESASPGVILNVQPASDLDSPRNGVDHYTMFVPDRGPFELEATKTVYDTFELKIRLLEQLDREYQFRHELILTAHDGGNPSLSGNKSIVFNVVDINDNSPKFIKPSLTVKVIENSQKGAVVYHLHAIDLDAGVNGKVMYHFTNETQAKFGDYFRIKANSGKIILKKSLDYENRHSYTLDIIAKDLGTNSIPAEAKVIVNVIDVNDNSPVISILPQYENKLLVMEDAKPGKFIAHISAIDKDSNQNGKVICSMNEESYDLFDLINQYDGEYKLVTRKLLDRETEDKYLVTIICTDQGSPVRSSKVTKLVIVTDVNDHLPIFDRDVYECVLVENNPPQTSIVQVTATEPDSGINGMITYKLGHNAGKAFRINETTGLIEAMAAVDRELIGDMIEFQVFAIDMAIIRQTSTASIQLTILDEDDEGPRFTQKMYTFSIYENVIEKTKIGVVSAHDADIEDHSKFSFYINASRSDITSFNIDPQTGEVFAKKPFNREKKAFHNVYITVQSDANSNFFDTSVVQVRIVDKNDNPPNITFPGVNNNKVYIANTASIGAKVTQVTAIDADEGLNQKLTYSFHHEQNDSPMKTSLFEIDEFTGTITLNGTVVQFVHEMFPYVVIVKDRGKPRLHSKAVINLYVTNKLSQQNAWDETRQNRDRGMSMVVRVLIVCIVVVLAVVTIISLSLLIRFIVVKTNWGQNGRLFGLNLPVHLNSNGFIPNSTVETPSGRYTTDDTENESETEPEQLFVKKHRKSSYSISSCPDLSEESSQPFLNSDSKYKPPKLETHRKFINKGIPPPPYSSSISSQSTETMDYHRNKHQRKRSLPKFPLDDDSCTTTSSKRHGHNRSHSVSFQSDVNISYPMYKLRGYHSKHDVSLAYATKVSVMGNGDMDKSLNDPIKIKVSDGPIRKGQNTILSKSLMEPIKLHTSGLNKNNPPIKIQLPDLQIGTQRRIGEAYPDLLQHRQRQRSFHFQQGSRRLKTIPYEDPWDNVHLQQGKLKHSIPGHCTIIASEGDLTNQVVDDLVLRKTDLATVKIPTRQRTNSCTQDHGLHRATNNSFYKKNLSVSTPNGLNTDPYNRLGNNKRMLPNYANNTSRYDTKSMQYRGVDPRLANQQNQGAKSPQRMLPDQLHRNCKYVNGVRKMHINSLDRNFNRNFHRPKDVINLMSGRQKVDNPHLYNRSYGRGNNNNNDIKNYGGSANRSGVMIKGNPVHYRLAQNTENGDSDGSYI